MSVWIARCARCPDLIAAALVVGLLSASCRRSGLQGLDLLDLPLGAIAIPAVWNSALATSLGPSLLIALAAMAAALLALRTASVTTARLLTAVAMVGRRAVAGGDRSRRDRIAAMADPAGAVPARRWRRVIGSGALSPLAAMAWRRQDASLLAVLQRFSRLAVPVVAVLVLTGLSLR